MVVCYATMVWFDVGAEGTFLMWESGLNSCDYRL